MMAVEIAGEPLHHIDFVFHGFRLLLQITLITAIKQVLFYLKQRDFLPAHTDLVLKHQIQELFPVNKRNGRLVHLACFLSGSGTKITCCHNTALLVRAQTAANLLNDRCLHICLPSFDLNGQFRPDYPAANRNHCPSYINPTIAA